MQGDHNVSPLTARLNFRRLVSVARSRTYREHQGKILLEGRRLICDALDAGAVPQMVFFSTVDRLRELPVDKLRRATLIKVKFEEMKVWSDLVTPQGVIGKGPFSKKIYVRPILQLLLTLTICLCSYIFSTRPITNGFHRQAPFGAFVHDMRQRPRPWQPRGNVAMCCCCWLP